MKSVETILDIGNLRLLWLLGGWTELATIRHADIAAHPDRQEIILLGIVGCQQCGLYDDAAALTTKAHVSGCPGEEIARWMLAGVDNTMGRAYSVIGDYKQGLSMYRSSISEAPGGIESDELAQARATYQAKLLASELVSVKSESSETSNGSSEQVFRKPASGIKSFAQNFEDVILWRALGSLETGCYVDIGSQDPVVDSVSQAFYQKGWRGVHVEPSPAYAEKIRRDRPDEVVFEAAVNDAAGNIEFYEIPHTGISTGDKIIAEGHVRRGFNVGAISVPCITLAEVLDSVGDRHIHWLKIDVEGMEASVLRSWGASQKRPWVVVVESTLPLSEVQSFEEWEPLLLEKGYKHVYFDGLNRFYLNSDQMYLSPAFATGPNVFDGYVLSGLSSTLVNYSPGD